MGFPIALGQDTTREPERAHPRSEAYRIQETGTLRPWIQSDGGDDALRNGLGFSAHRTRAGTH